MNNKEFEKEMLDFIHRSYEEFLNYQNIVNDILDEFHRVCKISGIDYFVGFGSLLGLIRDNGNIPWDYDIDVVVPINQRDDMIKALNSNLNSEYYYVYKNNTKHYPTSCLRVCKKGYSYMALHVDVFFLMGCPDNKRDKDKFIRKVSWAYRARQAHNLSYHLELSKKSRAKNILKHIFSYIKYPINDYFLSLYEDHLYFKYKYVDSKLCMIFYLWDHTFSTSSFSSSKTLEIGNRLVSIPHDYDKFLSEQYGDYHSYLPISCRFEEFYKMYNVVNSRQEFYEKKLKKHIE